MLASEKTMDNIVVYGTYTNYTASSTTETDATK